MALHSQERRLGYMLKRAQHALRLHMDSCLEPLALTTPQYNVLAAVEQDPGISNAALARGAFVTAQSMVGTVATLEKLGLLKRDADPDHGRVRMTRLTARGKRVLEKAHRALADVERIMTHGFTAADTDTFHACLLRCAENLSERKDASRA